ncbi:hypothetical protein AB0F17_34600 [Nonomuraea sp. NPDC026600]|uniref:hypothetical protein n=1 Tax=Nonomuraea sp. NPDC026600 TaxID=3155363 RepID=UPI0033CC7CE7
MNRLDRWKGGAAEYVRLYYGVPAYRGDRVVVDGRPGRIVGFRDARLRVRFDEQPRLVAPCHPTWRAVYVDGSQRARTGEVVLLESGNGPFLLVRGTVPTELHHAAVAYAADDDLVVIDSIADVAPGWARAIPGCPGTCGCGRSSVHYVPARPSSRGAFEAAFIEARYAEEGEIAQRAAVADGARCQVQVRILSAVSRCTFGAWWRATLTCADGCDRAPVLMCQLHRAAAAAGDADAVCDLCAQAGRAGVPVTLISVEPLAGALDERHASMSRHPAVYGGLRLMTS